MKETISILLAEDDDDDCLLFKEAIGEIDAKIILNIARDGVELIEMLKVRKSLPTMIFLDLNMPRKNGINSVTEIQEDVRLRSIPVIVLSTSLEKYMVSHLYETGVFYYVQKPNDFSHLKSLVKRAIKLVMNKKKQPAEKDFILSYKDFPQ